MQRTSGCVLAIASMALLAVSRYQLGQSFSVTPQARVLVTQGIYTRLRNPINIFSAVMLDGLILVLHRPRLWLMFVLLVPMQCVRARKEARVLEQSFGEAYRGYRKKTWF
jgi:protein-S-isoprenylcysteine O-methyltransferase Ste14